MTKRSAQVRVAAGVFALSLLSAVAGLSVPSVAAVGSASLSKANVAQGLPAGCWAALTMDNGTGNYGLDDLNVGLSFDGRKIFLTESELRMPEGQKRTAWVSEDDSQIRSVAIYPDGRAYEAVHLDSYRTATRYLGKTVKGVIDVARGETYSDKAEVLYLLTGDGGLYVASVTHDKKGRVSLGRPIPLRAKGWSKVVGFESSYHQFKGRKVTSDSFFAHTSDGKLIEGTATRGSQPKFTARTIAASGWGKVKGLGVGWCSKKNDRRVVLLSWQSPGKLLAHIDPNFDDGSLKGAQVLDLTRAAAANGFDAAEMKKVQLY